jgi:hypothetical protein
LEASGCGIVEVLFRYLLGGTEKKPTKIINYDIRYFFRDSNRAPAQCESRALPLRQQSRCDRLILLKTARSIQRLCDAQKSLSEQEYYIPLEKLVSLGKSQSSFLLTDDVS